MKDQILKIAKVKSEKEFYKKYPTEEAFMKAHGKELKKAAMGKAMVYDQLHQLTDFGNPPIAQYGGAVNPNTGMFNMPMTGQSVSQIDTMAAGYGSAPPPEGFGNVEGKGFDAAGAGMAALGALPGIIGGIEAIGSQKKAKKKAEQATKLSGLALQAQQTTEKAKRKYVRPEDALVQPGQLGNPYGSGTNFLSKNGRMIGGNPTEIQNMYNPGDMYTDLGFEPMGETLKQFKEGGNLPEAEFGEYFQNSGQAQIGSAAGTAIGSFVGGPLGGMVGGLIGKAAGNLLGGAKQARELQAEKDRATMNTQQAAFAQAQQNQFGAYMEQGGKVDVGDEYKWVSHTWQPQTIAKFGEYNVKDLLKPPTDADMLRSGGHLKDEYYTPPSAEAMYTGRAEDGTVLDSAIRAKTDLQSTTTDGRFSQNLRDAISSVDTYADGRPVERTDMYTMTKGRDDDQRVKQFLRSQTGEGAPQYSMQKTYKPLFGSQYKTVSKEIGAGRGERRMADMEQFLSGDNMEYGGQMAMGGDLQILEGGKAETISYNPFLPDGGETVMFRGRSHDNGGIPINFGENGVEVEGGEPAVKLENGGEESNMVVFGNMKINKNIADLMGDSKAKGKKFKHYVADIAKNDAKQLKRIDKANEMINNADNNSAAGHLTLITGALMKKGAENYQKINADKIQEAGIVQNAILDTASQLGVKSDKLAEGKLEKEYDKRMMAKHGKKLKKAQSGDYEYFDPRDNYLEEVNTPQNTGSGIVSSSLINPNTGMYQLPMSRNSVSQIDTMSAGYGSTAPSEVFGNAVAAGGLSDESSGFGQTLKSIGGFLGKGLEKYGPAILSNVAPFLRPSNANEDLPPDQLYPEYFALATNQLEPVQAQTFQPMLDTPMDISLNDQLNAIDSQSRAAIRAVGQNPAAQAMIMSQSLEAKNKVLGEQARINAANKMQTYDKNRALLNDAKLKNLQILDNQYVRQAQAKSNTKEQAFNALSSIAAKTAQQRAANRNLAIMENMYNFRFTPSGRAINVNAPAQFNIPGASGSQKTTDAKGNDLLPIYNKKGDITGYKVKEARHGSLVKALKNL